MIDDKKTIYVSTPPSKIAEALEENTFRLGARPAGPIKFEEEYRSAYIKGAIDGKHAYVAGLSKVERMAMVQTNPDYVDISAVKDQMMKIIDPLPRKAQRSVVRRIGLDEKIHLKGSEQLHVLKDAARAKVMEERVELQKALLDMLKVMALPTHCKLQTAEGSMLHKLQEAAHQGNVIAPVGPPTQAPELLGVVQPEFGQAVFLIEHDWASVFDKADELGEWRMPGDSCCFEFQISGRRFIATAIGQDGIPSSMIIFAKLSKTWTLCDSLLYDHGVWNRGIKRNVYGGTFPAFSLEITRQIRAISIMLDAEVAEHEIIRAPHKLNEQRERKGKLPLNSYHVVRLTKRSRGAPRLDRDPGTEPTHHKRLHWVRGHWRHFESSKTWIRWHLRGDEDLGIIEKEYRL